MFGDLLDSQQIALLWRIYRGEKSFPPPGDRSDEAACRDYNFLVETLIALRNRGYIARDDLFVQKGGDGPFPEYLIASVGGLTYEGEKVARSLDPAPAAPQLSALLSAEGLHQCRRDFERAVGSVATDPEQAIASASSLLESVCKAILERSGDRGSQDKSLGSLVKATLSTLDLAAESAAEPGIRGAIDGLASAAQAIRTVRNKSGAAHGRGLDHRPLEPRHARLAANAAATVGLFLLETALARTG
jgi:hypothetical protein